MEKKTSKGPSPLLRRLLTIGAIILFFVLARLLLGTQQMMYLSALDIDHIDVTVTPTGTTMTASGDDAAEAVKVLNKTVCYYPQQQEVTGQAVTLIIYMHDGSTMTVIGCGDHFTIDGKGYKTRLSDGEKLDQWAQALAEKQGLQS